MKTRLKQLAISLNENGVIGVENKLLFSAPADLAKFAQFTDGTVLIAGRKTAQQMINMGARVKRRRPLVIISENGLLEGTWEEDHKWIYFAPNLHDALILAHTIEIDLGLNGYTVVGGKQVYDDFFDLMDKGTTRVNRAYIFSHQIDPAVPAVTLSRDLAQIKKLIEVRMVKPFSVWSEADVIGSDHTGTRVRSKNGRFTHFTDAQDFNYAEVKKVGDSLVITTDGGEVSIDTYAISAWRRREDIASVEISLNGGQSLTVRPHSKAGLNSLLCALNMTSHN